MSVDVERVKKLVINDLLVEAVELPTSHKTRPLHTDDVEEILSRFDDDADHAHFIIRVKRAERPLPKPSESPQEPQLSIDSMVNETLELIERGEVAEQLVTDAPAPKTDEASQDPADYEPDFLLTNARLLEENGETELARNIYHAMVKKGLLIPQGLAGMARTYESDGMNEKAVRCYQEAIAYSSELPFYQQLAALQIRIGDDEQASQTILHALGLNNLTADQSFELHKSLGNCFTRLADYSKAEHHYKKAYELNSRSDALQVNVGSLALQKSDYTAAQKHFEKAIELNPKNDKAISGLGMVCLSRGETAKAHDFFVAGLRLNISNLGAIYNLVKCAYELKRFNDAADILRKHIESSPINTNILYSYAGILYHQGEYGKALGEVNKILESNPGHSGANELKALIQAKMA